MKTQNMQCVLKRFVELRHLCRAAAPQQFGIQHCGPSGSLERALQHVGYDTLAQPALLNQRWQSLITFLGPCGWLKVQSPSQLLTALPLSGAIPTIANRTALTKIQTSGPNTANLPHPKQRPSTPEQHLRTAAEHCPVKKPLTGNALH